MESIPRIPDTHIDVDVDSRPCYTISDRNNPVIPLSLTSSDGEIHYFRGNASITENFYFEITLRGDQAPSAVWLGFVYERWFDLTEGERFGRGLEQDCTWNYEPLTGSLKFGNTLYMHDPSTVDVETTIGFGVTRYTEKEENFWSILYIRSDGQGMEIVRKESLPNELYPVIRLAQSSSDLKINYTASFKYKDRQPFLNPHQAPIGLIECSPDRHYAACFSGDDGVLSVWRLSKGQDPEFSQHIPLREFKLKELDDASVWSRELPHDQFSLAVSNTDDNELPQIALGRYHTNLAPEECQICFLSVSDNGTYNAPFSRRDVVGNIFILDNGETLLITDSERLFVMNIKSKTVTHTFNRNHLDPFPSDPVFKTPLKPLGKDHFLWRNTPNYTTMWCVSTGRLEQAFLYTFHLNDKYDYNADRNLVAFYGINGLKIFTSQTGISICEADRVDMSEMKVVGVKFVTINGALLLVTIDGSVTGCVIGVWNPLTGLRAGENILITHTLSNEFKNSDVVIDGTELSSISFVTPLMATVACCFQRNPNETQQPPVDLFEKLELNIPPENYKLYGQPSQTSVKNLSVKQCNSPMKEWQVEIWGLKKHPVVVRPEPWNNHVLVCRWISEDCFVVAGRHTVQIINARTSTYTKLMIEFTWCLPSADATITEIKLITPSVDEAIQQMKIVYNHDGSSNEDSVDIASHSDPIPLKHALRYLQFSGANYRSRTSTVYERVVKEKLELMLTSGGIPLINEVDLKTKTSTFGHMVRGSPTEAAKHVQKVLDANAYRPLFYNAKLRDASALTEALSVGNFGVAEIIVKYCLKDEAKNNSGLLELGYFAIVVGALPIISRKRPKWAPLIAQYLSHIQLNRWISEVPETGEFQDDVFARVEQLSNYNQSGLRKWWSKQRKTFGLWWNGERLLHPKLCVSPLYGLNRYPEVVSRSLNIHLSVFAELAFCKSRVFDEPAFQAVVQYKWNTFAQWYHYGLLALYIAYALFYMIAVSLSPHTLTIPGVKITLVVLTGFFLVFFHLWPLLTRWNNITYWVSIYHWIDRAAFILVLVSTLLTSPDYDQSIDLQAWTVLALWLLVVFNFRVFPSFGLFFTLLIQIMKSLFWLVIFMAVIIFAFSHSMWILLHNAKNPPDSGNPFGNMDGSLNSLWQFLGGDFNAIDSWKTGRSTDIMRVLFTFISTIVLLNMLLAILNNVYVATQEIAQKSWIRNRAEFIATVEVFMLSAKQRQNKNWFPEIVFYEVSLDKFQSYEEQVKNNHPWR